MGEALAKLAEEDPTFRAHTDQETGQTIIAGMGELHLEIIVDRLLREFKVEANVGAPQVAYKETFTKPVDVDTNMQNSPVDVVSTDTVKLNLSRWIQTVKRHSSFESTVVGGAIPKEYIPAVRRRYRRSCSRQVSLVDSQYLVFMLTYTMDLTMRSILREMAFHIAGSMAFKEAMQKANQVLLEPIMKVEVTMPEEYMGDVIGDINSVVDVSKGMDDIGGGKMVKGICTAC